MRKMRSKQKFLYRVALPFILCAALAFCMAGCGEKESGPEWVYVPEFLAEDWMEEVSWYDAKLIGNNLYYPVYNWNEEEGRNSISIHRCPLADGASEPVEIQLPMEEDASLAGFTVGADGNIYAAFTIWRPAVSEGGASSYAVASSNSRLLAAEYSPDGQELLNVEFTDSAGGSDVYLNGICVDSQGRICVVSDSLLFLFDKEGNSLGTVETDKALGNGYVNSFCAGSDGKIYFSVTTYNEEGADRALFALNFETRSLEESLSGIPEAQKMLQEADGNFLFSSASSLCRYDVETAQSEKMFDWLDCDINGNYVTAFSLMEDGRIAVAYEDWQANDSGMALISKVAAQEADQKQEIVIGVAYQNTDLTSEVVRFNKNSDTYHVTVRAYVDTDNWSETSYTDGMARLNSDLTSKNAPDILDLSSVDVEQLVAKGVFEDLTPYIEQSEKLDRSDMLDGVMEAFFYDGKQISIPDSFQLETIIGSAAEVGTEMGWTLEDMIAFADAHPNQELFDSMTRAGMMNYCLAYNMDAFVDWETGECYFDSDTFRDLLAFVNRFPENVDYSADAPSGPTRIQNGEVLLYDAYLSDLDAMQMYIDMFGGDITCIGYPNGDGSAGCMLVPNGAYGIVAGSEVKEGAWAFLESYLTREETSFRWGFPNSRSELDKMVDEAVNVEYLKDENGDPMLDENGDPIPEGGTHGVGYGDWFYNFRVPTQEEVDMVLDLMDVAKLTSMGNQQILEIINEEAAPFFEGQKTAEEAASIIQNRVKNFVSENS